MKKLIILIILIAIGYGIWSLSNKTSTTPIPLSTKTASTDNEPVVHPDPSNGAYGFEEGVVTLIKGKSIQKASAGVSSASEITLTNTIGYGDLNNDGKEDAGVVLIQSGAGTGTFVYLAAYVSSPLNYKGTNAIYIGDRILPKSVSIASGEVTFTYLDRKPNEPMDAEPTVSAYKSFTLLNGILVEKN